MTDRVSARPASRWVFKVERPDGRSVEVETWSSSAEACRPMVQAWIDLHWPGARIVG